MERSEWESLCDGCGKCCVLKLEDIETGVIYYTDVGCKLLDCNNGRCQNYTNRKQMVPDCVVLTADNLDALHWMPKSCAYRLINEGHDFPDWHPSVTGTAESTYLSGSSVAGQVVTETSVAEADMPNHIRKWWPLGS